MQRMQREWKVEEERRRARREELLEEEREDGDSGAGTGRKRGGKGKEEEEDGNMWAHIAAKPLLHDGGGGGGGGLVGLHDVVLAPPKFKKTPGKTTKLAGTSKLGGNGAGSAIGLKRQAELVEARRRVVEGYRALMQARGSAG